MVMNEPARSEASPGRATILSGWGRTAPTRASVSTPAGAAEVVHLITSAAQAPGRGLLARGLGRAYGDAAQNAGGAVLDMSSLVHVMELRPDDDTVTAGAGVSVDALLRRLLVCGRFVPVTPGTRWVSLGGALAADVHGKNHPAHGSFADHVVSFDLVTASGEVRAVRPGDPAFAATAGGMGLTGVITAVTLRTRPVETAFMRAYTERAADLDECLDRLSSADPAHPYSVAWIDCLAGGGALGRAVITRGDHATRAELPPRRRADPLQFAVPRSVTGPDLVPSGLLSVTAVRAANQARFTRAAHRRSDIQPVTSFFYPLDALGRWNRLYGRSGFLQYQFGVPAGAEATLRLALQRSITAGCPAFLGVLKRLGPGNGHPLSFPQSGWTLALDLPASAPGLAALLDGLDEEVAAAGGRVYLAKDSRLRCDLLPAMYPRLGDWRRMRDALDPGGMFVSDLARRLGLASGPLT
jgi:decaprenylphospho-beta-D-ribofuranose 2-oxidase